MPSRIIRESILDSERYLELNEGEQLLFIHLLLLADDFGCVSLAPAFLGRRAFSERPGIPRMLRMLSSLADQDLIRIYETKGAKFAFIPRFGQRLRVLHLRSPIPPESVFFDDSEAQKKFKQFNENGDNLSGTCLSSDSGPRAEVEVKGSRRKAVDLTTKGQARSISDILNGSERKKAGINPDEQVKDQTDPLMLKAQAAGLTQLATETRGQFALRVAQASAVQPEPAPTDRPKGKFDD